MDDGHDNDGMDTAGQAWRALRVLVLEREDRRRSVAEHTGLSFNRVKALRCLTPGPLTLGALAEQLVSDRPYTTLVVQALEERGLVIRAPNPADRRSKLVHLTEQGRAVLATAQDILDEPPASLRALDANDQATLLRIVNELL